FARRAVRGDGADPEGRAVDAVALHRTELHDAVAAERREHRVVEPGGGVGILDLDGDVVEHRGIVPDAAWRCRGGRAARGARKRPDGPARVAARARTIGAAERG